MLKQHISLRKPSYSLPHSLLLCISTFLCQSCIFEIKKIRPELSQPRGAYGDMMRMLYSHLRINVMGYLRWDPGTEKGKTKGV